MFAQLGLFNSRMAPRKSKQQLSELIILEVQNHPSLWDKRCKDFKDFVVTSNAWENILLNLTASFSAEDLRSQQLKSEEDIKKHWRNLRDTYRKKKKEEKGQSGAATKDVKPKRPWPFMEMLRFLDQSDSYGFGTSGVSSRINFLHDEDDDNLGGDFSFDDDEPDSQPHGVHLETGSGAEETVSRAASPTPSADENDSQLAGNMIFCLLQVFCLQLCVHLWKHEVLILSLIALR